MQDCWDSYRGLWKAETFGIHPVYNVLLAPIPYIPTPNHSSSHSKLKSKRKPEPSVPVQLLALVLPGSTAPLMVRSRANMYLTGITKIRKVQGSSFWKTHSSSTSKGSLICSWSHDQSGAKWVKRGEKIKSNLRSCVKQVPYGPSEADHETSPECKYYLICLANVRNLSEHIQVRNHSLILCSFFCVLELCLSWNPK